MRRDIRGSLRSAPAHILARLKSDLVQGIERPRSAPGKLFYIVRTHAGSIDSDDTADLGKVQLEMISRARNDDFSAGRIKAGCSEKIGIDI